MFELVRYNPAMEASWNRFVAESKNGTFLFNRSFMDYHSDRFTDFSLVVFQGENIYALLPASAHGDEIRSHGGLTYGGLILGPKATVEKVVAIMEAIVEFYRKAGFKRLIYKPSPHIYHSIPAEEDLYGLFRLGASIIGRDASTTLRCGNHPNMRSCRRQGAKKSVNAGVILTESDDFDAFWSVLRGNLNAKFGVEPVHSLEEIRLLHERFPEQIRLHTAMLDGECVAGAVMFLTDRVAHVQYISATPEGKRLGALDQLFCSLIDDVYAGWPYFDFGKSTEGDGSVLNSDLMYQKEGFGGRTTVYDTYAVTLG